MSTTIAISGKGGSGKTTLAALIIRHLVERSAGSVLAVDADPNACLGLAIGLEPETTIGDLCDRTLEGELSGAPGMSRPRAFEYAIHRAVAEAKGFDLLVMGHTEGPKCYCAVNHLLRSYLDSASRDYRFVVLDCEAGMEHLSRRTTTGVEFLLIATEATVVGARTAERILGLSERLPIAVGQRRVLWNKVPASGALPPDAERLPSAGTVPYDPAVADLAARGGTIFELPAEAPACRAIALTVTELLGAAHVSAP